MKERVIMSVLVTMKVTGDTDQFRRFEDEDRVVEISKAAQAAGCLHHRFGSATAS